MDKVEIAKQDGRSWGYAYLCPRTEKKIEKELRLYGIPCYLPTRPHAYMDHRTKVITYIPMFPSYIFLSLGREEATDLRYKVRKILSIELLFDEAQEKILLEEMRALQKCEELAKISPILVNPGIQKGDKVLITSGPLANLVTDVVRRDDRNDSIVINISMLGRHIEYPVTPDILQKITE